MSALRFLLLTAVFAAGCNARYACEDGDDGVGGFVADSGSVGDSFLAAAVGDDRTWRLRATLTDLPELWSPNSAILDSALRVGVSLVYETPPLGGDGRTEMPRVQVSFPDLRDEGTNVVGITAKLHGPGPQTFEVRPFIPCSASVQTDCCPYGSRECAVDVTLNLERVDGTPFPPVNVSFSAEASAQTSACPLEREQPSLSLAVDP